MRRLPGAAAAAALLAVLLGLEAHGYELPDNSAVILPDGTELHLMHALFGPVVSPRGLAQPRARFLLPLMHEWTLCLLSS